MVVTLLALGSTFAFKSGFEAQARRERGSELARARAQLSFCSFAPRLAPCPPQEDLAKRDAKTFNAKKRPGTK